MNFSLATFDNEQPVIQNCPNDISLTLLPGRSSVQAFWLEPTATDNDNMVPDRVRSHAPGDSFRVGQTVVAYTFTDSSDNVAVCSFTVSVSRKSAFLPFFYLLSDTHFFIILCLHIYKLED